MAIVRWNPAQDLMRMREEMDNLFQQFLRPGSAEESSLGQGLWAPPVDIVETDDALVMKVELPGFSKDDIQIELHDGRLTLRGERKYEKEVKEEQYRRRERAYGHFERSFLLPTVIDQDKVTAEFKNGVLELRLPKSQAAKPKRISVTEAESAAAAH